MVNQNLVDWIRNEDVKVKKYLLGRKFSEKEIDLARKEARKSSASPSQDQTDSSFLRSFSAA